jgi:hypothetical protein
MDDFTSVYDEMHAHYSMDVGSGFMLYNVIEDKLHGRLHNDVARVESSLVKKL